MASLVGRAMYKLRTRLKLPHDEHNRKDLRKNVHYVEYSLDLDGKGALLFGIINAVSRNKKRHRGSYRRSQLRDAQSDCSIRLQYYSNHVLPRTKYCCTAVRVDFKHDLLKHNNSPLFYNNDDQMNAEEMLFIRLMLISRKHQQNISYSCVILELEDRICHTAETHNPQQSQSCTPQPRVKHILLVVWSISELPSL